MTQDTDEQSEIDRQIKALDAEIAPLRRQSQDLRRTLQFLRAQIASAETKQSPRPAPLQATLDSQRDTIDLIYLILTALKQQPDPTHIQSAYDHWRAMIAENRRFWSLLSEETDNDREWIPNATQVSALPIDVPQETAQAWQDILADAEAMLEGKLLIPHPLLPSGYGIHLPSYVENPAPLDLLDWIHGVGTYAFAAKGPKISNQNWVAFQRLTGGNAGGFALFFN